MGYELEELTWDLLIMYSMNSRWRYYLLFTFITLDGAIGEGEFQPRDLLVMLVIIQLEEFMLIKQFKFS